MSIEKITEKLVKVTVLMIENDTCGILSLDQLITSSPELTQNDTELLYTNCKIAAEAATTVSSYFTRQVMVSFQQSEKFENGEYVPDCAFHITWAT